MLDYTKASVKKTIDDFKQFAYFYNIGSQVLYIVYLIYAIFAPAGNLVANILLGITSLAYLIFYIVIYRDEDKEARLLAKMTKRIHKWFKFIVKGFTLGVMLYGIYAATTHITPFSVAMAAFTVVAWVLQVLFELALYFLDSRAKLIIAGIEADFENMIKPVHTVGNIIKKATGKVVEEKKEPTRQRKILDGIVLAAREEKRQKKDEAKRQRAEKMGSFFKKFKPKKTEKADTETALEAKADAELLDTQAEKRVTEHAEK